MNELNKRLEIILRCIIENNYDLIPLQILKIQLLETNDMTLELFNLLEKENYSGAQKILESTLLNNKNITLYKDKELEFLRLKLTKLESSIEELNEVKNQYLNDIREFKRQYNLYLGDIIQKILKLQNEKLKQAKEEKEAIYQEIKDKFDKTKTKMKTVKDRKEEILQQLEQTNLSDLEYEELSKELEYLERYEINLENQYENEEEEVNEAEEEYIASDEYQEYLKTKQEYEDFEEEYHKIQTEERNELNKVEKKELKKLYREASKLCHPDIVEEDLKEEALEVFKALNDANSKMDLNKVREIYDNLKSAHGLRISVEKIDDKEFLQSKISKLLDIEYSLHNELNKIKTDTTFKEMSSISDNWTVYFSNIKNDLLNKYTKFKDEVIEPKTRENNYWNEEF